MKSKDKVLELLKNNKGVVTTREVSKIGVSRKTLTRMIKEGIIERDSRGVYISLDSFGDEYYGLIHNKCKVVYSHFTALYFHNMCERSPLVFDITVPYHYSSNLLYNDRIIIHYVKPDLLDLGRIKINSPQGKLITAYDIERCICDITKISDKIDVELLKYAYKTYLKSSKKDLVKIMEYAKKLGVSEKVNFYIQIFS